MTVVNESLTRPVPRRACCLAGHPLIVVPDRPSFWHDDPPRPCLTPAGQHPRCDLPRRALPEDLDRTELVRAAQGKEHL